MFVSLTQFFCYNSHYADLVGCLVVMLKKLNLKVESLQKLLTNEDSRASIQFASVYAIFAIVSLVMTIINIFTYKDYKALMWSTLIFTLLNVLNLLLCLKRGKYEIASRYLFSFEIIALFTFFIIVGQPQGFSALWCAILPLGGMLLYKRKVGSILCGIMFIILAVCFWIPWENLGTHLLQYEYTDSFRLRFPVFFISCYAIGFFFELVRLNTQRELEKSRNRYETLSYTDLLTGLNNRNRYEEKLKSLRNTENLMVFVAFVDANGLHKLNDDYGHEAGDRMLVGLANALVKSFKQDNCYRIGGDEFVVLMVNPAIEDLNYRLDETAEKLARDGIFVAKGCCLSNTRLMSMNEIINTAEKNMYKDKAAYYQKTGFDRRRE